MTESNQIVFWLNGSRIISTNRRVYVDRQRVSVEGYGNTYNLRVLDVREWDEGQYSCQVPTPHTITQTSRVIISSKFNCSQLRLPNNHPITHLQQPNLCNFITSSLFNVLAVLALHPSLLLLGHRHHPLQNDHCFRYASPCFSSIYIFVNLTVNFVQY